MLLVGIKIFLGREHEREDGAGDRPVIDRAEEELREEGGEEGKNHVGLRSEVRAEGTDGGTVWLGLVLEEVGGKVVDGGGALGGEEGVDRLQAFVLGLDNVEKDGGRKGKGGRDVVPEEDLKESKVGLAELGEGEDFLEGDGEGHLEGNF